MFSEKSNIGLLWVNQLQNDINGSVIDEFIDTGKRNNVHLL